MVLEPADLDGAHGNASPSTIGAPGVDRTDEHVAHLRSAVRCHGGHRDMRPAPREGDN